MKILLLSSFLLRRAQVTVTKFTNCLRSCKIVFSPVATAKHYFVKFILISVLRSTVYYINFIIYLLFLSILISKYLAIALPKIVLMRSML